MADYIYITRHGMREDFVNPKWKLTAENPDDPPLSKEGIIQANELAQRLKKENISVIYSSPFLRTIQTSYYIAETLNIKIKIEYGLMEWLNPAWFNKKPELQPTKKLISKYQNIDPDYKSLFIPTFPEKETEALRRAGNVAKRLIQLNPSPILLVGHGASVWGAVRGILNEEPDINPCMCCLIKLEKINNKWISTIKGDSSFLTIKEKKLRFN